MLVGCRNGTRNRSEYSCACFAYCRKFCRSSFWLPGSFNLIIFIAPFQHRNSGLSPKPQYWIRFSFVRANPFTETTYGLLGMRKYNSTRMVSEYTISIFTQHKYSVRVADAADPVPELQQYKEVFRLHNFHFHQTPVLCPFGRYSRSWTRTTKSIYQDT